MVQLGGTDFDHGSAVAIDSDGNIYVAGIFAGTTDFDPGPGAVPLTAPVSGTVFVVKLDSTGSLLWARAFGQSNGERPVSLAVSQSQDVFVAGSFSVAADFDPGSTAFNLTPTNDSADTFVVKLDENGNLDWVRTFGGDGSHQSRAIALDASSNVYLVGRFIGSSDLKPGGGAPFGASGDEGYLVKIDSTGNFGWAKTFGGAFSDITTGVALDSSGNIFVAGTYSSTADLDPGPGAAAFTAMGMSDAFLVKLDPTGSYQWAKSFGGTNSESTFSVVVDPSGDAILAGVFRGSGDFDPNGGTVTLTSAGDYDMAVAKVDPNGTLVWAKSFGGTDWDDAWGLATDGAGNVFVTGTFGLSGDFDPGPATATLSVASYGVYIVKLSSSGSYDWARAVGGASYDVGNSIAVDSLGNSYTTGYFDGVSDFDPGNGTATLTSNAGNQDVFLLKLDPAGNATIDAVPPTVTWTSPTSPSTSRTVTFTATFSEAVSGIAASDFTNTGTATGCTFTPSAATASTSITVTVTCMSDGTVILQLNANGVRDSSFNTGPATAAAAASVTIESPPEPSTDPEPTVAPTTAPTTVPGASSAAPSSNTMQASTTTTQAPAVVSGNAAKKRNLPSTGRSAAEIAVFAALLVTAGWMALRRRPAQRP